jgi:hypothetical protein
MRKQNAIPDAQQRSNLDRKAFRVTISSQSSVVSHISLQSWLRKQRLTKISEKPFIQQKLKEKSNATLPKGCGSRQICERKRKTAPCARVDRCWTLRPGVWQVLPPNIHLAGCDWMANRGKPEKLAAVAHRDLTSTTGEILVLTKNLPNADLTFEPISPDQPCQFGATCAFSAKVWRTNFKIFYRSFNLEYFCCYWCMFWALRRGIAVKLLRHLVFNASASANLDTNFSTIEAKCEHRLPDLPVAIWGRVSLDIYNMRKMHTLRLLLGVVDNHWSLRRESKVLEGHHGSTSVHLIVKLDECDVAGRNKLDILESRISLEQNRQMAVLHSIGKVLNEQDVIWWQVFLLRHVGTRTRHALTRGNFQSFRGRGIIIQIILGLALLLVFLDGSVFGLKGSFHFGNNI